MLFLFWPVGLVMLINRLRNAARYLSKNAPEATRPPAAKTERREPEVAVMSDAAVSGTETAAKAARKDEKKSAENQKRAAADSAAAGRLEKERRTAKRLSVLLAIASSLALAAGVYLLSESGFSVAGMGIWDTLPGLFYCVGGAVGFGVREIFSGRVRLRRRYLAKLGVSRVMRVSEFAAALGRSERNVRRELQAMIDDGYFGDGAYIDSELGALVLDASEVGASPSGAESRKRDSGKAELSEYDRVIAELRTLNEKISDPGISYKIERVENASAKIFAAVQESPDKLPQIHRFMSYYLPTTLKLLRSYATLERQEIRGENITSAKESIDRVLGTLAAGFERQLDRLFRSDVIDISSDIDVLEGMLARDGLSEASPFKSRTSTGEIV
jgi:hypothetical protein